MNNERKSGLYFLVVFALFAIIAIMTDEAFAVWYNPNWGFRQKITIDSSQVPGDLTNFPVQISTTDPSLRVLPGGKVGKTNGGDILFTDSEGIMKLDHEIESYNSATGELVAWVEVPNVSSTADTVISMYYGNPGAADQWNVSGTWDSNYLGVWHLSENPTVSTDCAGGTGTKEVCDSTSNNVDGDAMNMVSGDQVPGQIDGSLNFDQTNNYVDLGNTINLTDNITVEAWFNTRSIPPPPTTDTRWRTIVGDRWEWQMELTGNVFYGSPRVTFRRWGPYRNVISSTTILTDQWYYVAATLTPNNPIDWNFDNFKLYINGVLDNEGPMQTPLNTSLTSTLRISGRIIIDLDWFDGLIDEVRISDSVRSADWIETSYNNQNNPSSFLTFSVQQAFTLAPTMTEWGMIIFMILAGIGAFIRLRENRA